MPKFLVLKILDSQSITLPNTLVYGSVELRPAKSDSEDEVEILKESASLNRADFDKYSYCARIATIVDSNNIAEAIDSSDNLFSTVLDLKSKEFVISNVKTSDIGFVKELESGGIHPIPKAGHGLSMSFVVNQGEVQQFDSVNHILSLDSDLSNRYLRSLHWSRNSKHESKTQLKILFHWFSIEALLKESENDNVGGIVRWFLGFPNGRYRNDVTASCLATIRDHPSYTYWDKELIDIVDRIRVFRNDSVHAGFRACS